MTEQLSVADVLERAADLIAERGWTQHAYARDRHGEEIGVSSEPIPPEAACLCFYGAIALAEGVPLDKSKASDWVSLDKGFRGVDWNDAPGRTQAEVVAKLREAAAKAREQSL